MSTRGSTSGVVYVHSSPSAVCPHVEWAISGTLGERVDLRWAAQPAAQGQLRAECAWTGDAGTGGRLVSALRAWPMLRFEVTEDPWSTDYDPSTGAGAFAVEFVVPAVTSPYNTFDPVTTEEDDLKKGCPHLAWTNLKQNGFAVIDVTAEQVQCDFYVFGSIKDGSDGVAEWAKGFVVKSGSAHAIAADTAAG